jgi:large subunit ribosomal protein L14e
MEVIFMAFELGSVCVKMDGRESGRYCVVVKPAGKEKEKRSFVLVTGPRLLTGVKRRLCNVSHLVSTEYKVEVADGAADEAVLAALEKGGLVNKLNLRMPSAGLMKAEAERQKNKPAPAKKEKPQKAKVSEEKKA